LLNICSADWAAEGLVLVFCLLLENTRNQVVFHLESSRRRLPVVRDGSSYRALACRIRRLRPASKMVCDSVGPIDHTRLAGLNRLAKTFLQCRPFIERNRWIESGAGDADAVVRLGDDARRGDVGACSGVRRAGPGMSGGAHQGVHR
jgi:hypothetical protein